MGPAAFISYAREDGDAVDGICHGLTERGYTVWIDRDAVPYSASWRQQAQAGIDAATAVVCVVSANWIASPSCRFEYEHALAAHKRLIPVALSDDIDADQVPRPLAELNWIPLGNDDSLDLLAQTLDTDLPWQEVHARLLVRATEWERAGRDQSLLMRGKDLRAAEQWLGLERTVGQATALQVAYIVDSRGAAIRRRRLTVGSVAGTLLVVLVIGAVAEWQRRLAGEREQEAAVQRGFAVEGRSRELAGLASTQGPRRRDRALLLALEAYRLAPTVDARSQLLSLLQASGRLRATTRLDGPAFDIAVSADGRVVAAATERSVTAWRLPDLGSPMRQAAGARALGFAARNPDRLAIASGRTVRVWDLRRGTARRVDMPRTRYTAVAIDPPGRTVAAGARGGAILVRRASAVARVAAHVGDVTALRFNGRGSALASAGAEDGVVRVFRVRGVGLTRAARLRIGAPAFDLAFSRDGSIVAVAGADGVVRLWRWRVDRVARRIRVGASPVLGVAFDPRRERLATAQIDGRIRLLPLHGRDASVLPRQGGAVYGVAFADHGRALVSAGEDATMRVWRTAQAIPLATTRAHAARAVTAVAIDARGSLVATADADGTIVARRRSGQRRARLPPRAGAQLAVSGDGAIVAVASREGRGWLWDGSHGRPQRTTLAAQWPFKLAVSQSGLAVAAWDGVVRLWHAGRARTLLPSGPTPGTAVAFSPQDGVLAAGDLGGGVRVADVGAGRAMGKPLAGGEGGRVNTLAFSADGTLLAAGDSNGAVRLWDIERRSPVGRPLVAADSDVIALAFSPDASTLAVGDARGSVRLWDVDRRRPIGHRLAAHQEVIATLAFDPRGALIGVDQAGQTLRWDPLLASIAPAAWVRRVCRLVARPLTQAEWAQYISDRPYRPACVR